MQKHDTLTKVISYIKWFFTSFVFLAPLMIIIDQVTKLTIYAANVQNFAVIKGFFYISVTKNPGIAWGKFAGVTWLWAIFSLVAGIAMCFYLFKKYKILPKLNRIALLLMIGGCFGNMIDRMFYDGVIDFLEFHFGSYQFPTFNVADSSLVIGVILFIILLTFEESASKKTKKSAPEVEIKTDEANN